MNKCCAAGLLGADQPCRAAQDWALLHQHGGMRSFAAAPVMGQRLLGVLVLAGQDPAAFSEPW